MEPYSSGASTAKASTSATLRWQKLAARTTAESEARQYLVTVVFRGQQGEQQGSHKLLQIEEKVA